MKSLSEKAPSMIVTGEHRMGPPLDSVQLPYKWLNSMVYGRYIYIYIVNKVYKTTNITGGAPSRTVILS